MVHFVIEAVSGMPGGHFKENRRGTGSAQYPPKTLLALVIYCYANGVFSSRRIEAATYRDVGVRYLTADTHPDHSTICAFRRENAVAIHEAAIPQFRGNSGDAIFNWMSSGESSGDAILNCLTGGIPEKA